MIRRFSAILVVAVLACACSALVRAQDTTKAAPPAEGKSEMMKSDKDMGKSMGKEMGKGMKMSGPMYSVDCDPTCGFMVRSHDQKEVTDMVIRHAQKAHNKKVTAKEVQAMMKTEEAPPKQ